MSTCACPVLSFTPDVERILALFDITHELRADRGFVRVGYPDPGGPGDQDALLADELEWVRAVSNELVVREWRRQAAAQPVKAEAPDG